jgi:hypothetical protein
MKIKDKSYPYLLDICVYICEYIKYVSSILMCYRKHWWRLQIKVTYIYLIFASIFVNILNIYLIFISILMCYRKHCWRKLLIKVILFVVLLGWWTISCSEVCTYIYIYIYIYKYCLYIYVSICIIIYMYISVYIYIIHVHLHMYRGIFDAYPP